MATALDSLDARVLELNRLLGEIILDAPPGRKIRLSQLNVTIEILAATGETMRLGIVAPCDVVIQRPETKPRPRFDSSGVPDIDMEEFARGAGRYVPPGAMLDEDWSDHESKLS